MDNKKNDSSLSIPKHILNRNRGVYIGRGKSKKNYSRYYIGYNRNRRVS